jgi:putative transposase
MPNHFHLLIKQVSDDGIKKYLSIIQNSYAKFFNIKNDRVGGLFVRPFKAKWIENDKLFLHVSRYIHLNPTTSFLIDFDQLLFSNLTSLPFYLKENNSDESLVNTKMLLSLAGTKENYLKFVQDREDYQKKLHLIKNISFD